MAQPAFLKVYRTYHDSYEQTISIKGGNWRNVKNTKSPTILWFVNQETEIIKLSYHTVDLFTGSKPMISVVRLPRSRLLKRYIDDCWLKINLIRSQHRLGQPTCRRKWFESCRDDLSWRPWCCRCTEEVLLLMIRSTKWWVVCRWRTYRRTYRGP